MIAIVARAKPDRRDLRSVAMDRFALTVLGLLGMVTVDANAQPDAGADANRPFSIVSSLSVNETLTNNAGLTATDRQADLITQVSPALRMRSAAGWAQGFLNYSIVGVDYARGTDANSIQQSLDAAVTTQALDHHLFMYADASISRQNISAFGTQTPDASLRTGNQTQVTSLDAAPYLQGNLAGVVAYRVGVDYATTHSGSGTIGNSTNTGESVHLGTNESTARAAWALDVSHEDTDFSLGRSTTTESAVGSLIFNPDAELQFSLRGGREANNVESLYLKNTPTYGGGMRWTPSERTTLSLQDDKRYFGNSYALSFQHRTGQTVWTLSDSRQVVSDASAASQGQLTTAFDLIYLQLTSKYPDPITRASQTLLELQALGLDPLVVVPSGFLTNAVSLQHNLMLSFAYIGLRTSFLVFAEQSDSNRLDPLSSAVDSLAEGGTIRQRSISLSASHRLTPQSSANLDFVESRTVARVTSFREALRTITANWVTQLGLRTQLSLGARRSISTGDSSYTESALLASFTLQI
jgi:uncharacterized protein (PEP-CTERM system associated)